MSGSWTNRSGIDFAGLPGLSPLFLRRGILFVRLACGGLRLHNIRDVDSISVLLILAISLLIPRRWVFSKLAAKHSVTKPADKPLSRLPRLHLSLVFIFARVLFSLRRSIFCMIDHLFLCS